MAFFRNLFKESGVRDVITIFHAPASSVSIRAHTILKQAAANAQSTATIDQAGEHGKESKTERTDFDLEVHEGPPTPDQLGSILEYLGPSKAGSVVKDATGASDAMRKFNKDAKVFQSPVIVDWNRGRAVVGDDESEILKLLRTPKDA
ncbi:hypothetical protein LTR08_000620 [Meristemomyces frigidus]|nr:hypothetical protein LTR08_000620 [Meristemomyces frigidus]